jgi:hypothetical protein
LPAFFIVDLVGLAADRPWRDFHPRDAIGVASPRKEAQSSVAKG